MPGTEPHFSKTQVRNAGQLLRRLRNGERFSDEEVDRALTIVEDWRACHAYPLTKARVALNQRLRTVDVEGDVGQRLKRTARIISKLERFPSMQLTTMQDIGGCRAVVPAQADVTRITEGWRVNSRLIRPPYDYVRNRQPSGYRAIHLVVRYDGFPVEIQLRTRLQHDWAYTVEKWAGRLGYDLKAGEGPPEVLEFLAAMSEGMTFDEAGEPVPATLMDHISQRRRRFREWVNENWES